MLNLANASDKFVYDADACNECFFPDEVRRSVVIVEVTPTPIPLEEAVELSLPARGVRGTPLADWSDGCD